MATSIPSLFTVLQYLRSLESLYYNEHGAFKSDENKKWQLLPIESCTIKKLHFNLLVKGSVSLELFGQTIKHMLTLCPFLEIFHLSSGVRDFMRGSVLDIRFYNNPLLMYISSYMDTDYYTFMIFLKE